jgi:hypothetical protein
MGGRDLSVLEAGNRGAAQTSTAQESKTAKAVNSFCRMCSKCTASASTCAASACKRIDSKLRESGRRGGLCASTAHGRHSVGCSGIATIHRHGVQLLPTSRQHRAFAFAFAFARRGACIFARRWFKRRETAGDGKFPSCLLQTEEERCHAFVELPPRGWHRKLWTLHDGRDAQEV